MTFNRTARREMAKRFRAQGRDVVVLRGGPMDGWVVPSTAPALRADWRTLFLEGEAERLFLLTQEQRPRLLRRRWARLSPEEREGFLVTARAEHGAGRYQLKASEALATWMEG